jgi:glutathione peroxidase
VFVSVIIPCSLVRRPTMRGFKLAVAAVLVAGCAAATGGDNTMAGPLDRKMKGIDGKEVDLATLKGKVVLVVNVASQCGYTRQYEGLQTLYAKYKNDGLVVLGVPSNDYGQQEPGTDAEIKQFCSTNYKVTFPMLSKVTVKGPDKAELYKVLTAATPDKKEVGWNFEKFLINRKGEVVGRYKSAVEPTSDELVKAIKAELDKK